METTGLFMVILGVALSGVIQQRHYRKTGYKQPMPRKLRIIQFLLICVMTAGAIMVAVSRWPHGG